jgi:hypothetical protein
MAETPPKSVLLFDEIRKATCFFAFPATAIGEPVGLLRQRDNPLRWSGSGERVRSNLNERAVAGSRLKIGIANPMLTISYCDERDLNQMAGSGFA